MKTCTKCNERKELTEYGKMTASKDGLKYNCNICTKDAARKWAANNPEKCKEKSKRYRTNNPEKVKEARIQNNVTRPYVYSITNLLSGQKYYGMTCMLDRWRIHKVKANTTKYRHLSLYDDIFNLGLENFEFKILATFDDRSEALELETKLINRFPACYNILKKEVNHVK